ncbi:hypothetical protein ACPYO6_02020 [Georgenia sp. Z1344]|uniref:hypothetical protein n=1 Tax=Georgenia sp. Z1344 TaxID=3416706 RepID=UPI003CF5BF4D
MRRRRPLPPADVRAHLAKDPLLAASELADGSWALASPVALVIATAGEQRLRRPWHEILHARWDGESRLFSVTYVDTSEPVLELRTKDDDVQALADVVRERVTSSLVHTLRRELPNGSEVHVHIRRGEDGELLSQTTTTGPLAGDTEEAQVILAAEAEARGAVGLGE